MSFTCNFTSNTLQRMLPHNKHSAVWWQPLSQQLPAAQITTRLRVAAFISQCAHESSEFRVLQENLNYSALALQRVWPRHFPTAQLAQQYARQPQRIANRAYANRMGNGAEHTGDGWRFRGRGLIQLTGRNNYAACSSALFGSDQLLQEPDLLLQPQWAVASACWFWQRNALNRWADAADITALTRAINGGTNGLDHRIQLWHQCLQWL